MIEQIDNFRPKDWGTLGKITFNQADPVVQLIHSESGEVVYTLRIKGKSFTPHAPKKGTFTIKAGRQQADTTIAEKLSVGQAKPIKAELTP